MSIETRGYIIQPRFLIQSAQDSVATGEENTFESGVNIWLAATSRRLQMSRAGLLTNFFMVIVVNDNTNPGATMTVQIGGVAVNQSVALGTGAGDFEDLTNTDRLELTQTLDVVYTQQDAANVTFRSMSIQWHQDSAT